MFGPCFDCAKLIVQAGVSRVVYREMYTNKNCMEALALLSKAGVVVTQIQKREKISEEKA